MRLLNEIDFFFPAKIREERDSSSRSPSVSPGQRFAQHLEKTMFLHKEGRIREILNGPMHEEVDPLVDQWDMMEPKKLKTNLANCQTFYKICRKVFQVCPKSAFCIRLGGESAAFRHFVNEQFLMRASTLPSAERDKTRSNLIDKLDTVEEKTIF